MANARIVQRSFSGGEVSPVMFGRFDDAKYQSGLARCRNFIPKPQGPVENRPGFEFVCAVKDSSKATRVIPFTYSTTQTMVIEMGPGYLRFHTNCQTLLAGTPDAWSSATAYSVGSLVAYGGVNYYCIFAHTNQAPPNSAYWYALPASGVYEIPAPYAEADLFDVHFVQSSDVITLVHPNYPPRELLRYGATKWVLQVLSTAPRIAAPGGEITTGTPIAHSYKVTALVNSSRFHNTRGSTATETPVESLPSAAATCNNDLTIAGAYNSISWPQVTKALGYRVYRLVGSIYRLIGSATKNSFIDDSALPYGTDVPPSTGGTAPTGVTASAVSTSLSAVTATAFVPSVASGVPTNITAMYYAVTASDGTYESVLSSVASCNNNIYLSGAYNTITWPAVAGATHYNVYRKSGGMFGYIGQATDTVFVDDNIAPDLGKTPPTYTEPFVGSGNYPGAVSYFEQRRCFAGSIKAPQNFWGTKSGTESDLSYSLPIRDDDRISFRVNAREANTIRHIVPLSQLLLLTSAAEWRVTSINSDAITPTTISVKPQSYVGASNVQPVIVNNTLLYGAARGGHIRELAYNWQANGFLTGDLSLRASHLFDTFNIVDMAYAKAPSPIAWFISSSGKLLGLTYVPEQQIGAWHWHDTDGVFESCAVVAEGDEDALYCVIRRTINGASKRYIERLHTRQFVDQADAFFVDCGMTYDGAAATTISGLSHLEGKTVNILADGAVHPQRVVTSGQITLGQAASVVQVGLPIEADIETLPVALALRDGSFAQGHVKNVNKLWLRVFRSSGIFAGPDAEHLVEAKQRTTEAYGAPPALKSDEIELTLSPSWGATGKLFVRQYDPLPLTLVSLSAEVALG